MASGRPKGKEGPGEAAPHPLPWQGSSNVKERQTLAGYVEDASGQGPINP
jgi:hypothetical protein